MTGVPLVADPHAPREGGINRPVVDVAVGVLIRQDGDFLLTTRPPGKVYAGYWEFPGGKVELGEPSQQALVRELKEELDVIVSVDDFLCTVEYDYPSFHLTMHCFFCTIKSGELTLIEHKAAKWLSKSELHSVNWLPADTSVIDAIIKS